MQAAEVGDCVGSCIAGLRHCGGRGNLLNSDHNIGIRTKRAAEEVNRLRGWKRTEDRFEENKTCIKKDCLTVLSGMSSFSWEKYSAALEAKDPNEKNNGALWTAFLLFAGYVDAATSFAQNCGGEGAAPDQNWGRDKNEDDILWARRCFRKAHEMITTPVRRRGRRR